MKWASFILLFCSAAFVTKAQTSEVLAWNNEDAYQPMPIICVHGIASDSKDSWAVSVGSLSNYFSNTYYKRGSVPGIQQIPGYSPSVAYVETFDYGTYQNPTIVTNYGHLQTFDDIRGNASLGVYSNSFQVGNPTTLSNRIAAVRDAYQDANNKFPPVILLAHSMGGLLSHYYLTQAQEDGSVLRLATFGTPHYGSDWANLVRTVMGPFPSWARRIGAWGLQKTLQSAGVDMAADVGNFFKYAYPGPYPEKLGMQQLAENGFLSANPLITYFNHNPVPSYGEYIFNSFRWAEGISRWMFFFDITAFLSGKMLLDPSQEVGDLIVPVWSQEGRPDPWSSPTIMQGTSSLDRPIRPVIFGKTIDPNVFAAWNHIHMGEASVWAPVIKSLCGVTYTNSGDCGQNFSNYLPLQDWLPSGDIITHSDEPGIRDLMLLCVNDAHDNPFVIPALDTWDTDGYSPPQNMYTDRTNLVGHQIIGGSGTQLRVVGMTGAKNRAETPVGSASDGEYNYYWAQDGNEYLPASLRLRFDHLSNPYTYNLPLVTDAGFQSGLITNCLTTLDANGAPQFQYGLFDQTFDDITLSQSSDPTYFFTRGVNLAGLNTPIAERGLEVPLASADLKWIMCAINEREQAAGLKPTHWKQWVTEWVDVPADATEFTLNFFPAWNPNEYCFDIEDAFTATGYYDWTDYAVGSKTFTIPSSDAPRCLKVDYEAYLGDLDSFTTNYDGDSGDFTVEALEDNTLAGISLDPGLIGRMQEMCGILLHYFVDHTHVGLGGVGDFTESVDIYDDNEVYLRSEVHAKVLTWADTQVTADPENNIAEHSIFTVSIPDHTSWRRRTGDTQGWAEDGYMDDGDVVGNWLGDDLKAVVKNLKWVKCGEVVGTRQCGGSGDLDNDGWVSFSEAHTSAQSSYSSADNEEAYGDIKFAALDTAGWYYGYASTLERSNIEKLVLPKLETNGASYVAYVTMGSKDYDLPTGFVDGMNTKTDAYDGSGLAVVNWGDTSGTPPWSTVPEQNWDGGYDPSSDPDTWSFEWRGYSGSLEGALCKCENTFSYK